MNEEYTINLNTTEGIEGTENFEEGETIEGEENNLIEHKELKELKKIGIKLDDIENKIERIEEHENDKCIVDSSKVTFSIFIILAILGLSITIIIIVVDEIYKNK